MATNVRRLCELGVAPGAAKEIAAQIKSNTSGKSEVVAATNVFVSKTTGTAPVANGGVTIADAASPTVNEVFEFCIEINAKLSALITALKA